MIDIEKMKAAALAATQGEWVVSDHIYASDGKRIASYQMISRDDCENEANATHIATANPAAVLELIEKYKALEAKYERLKPRHEAYVKMLGELLAVLHADGGHYQYEHGTEKAVEDSITKHYELKRQLAECKELLSNLMEVVEEPPESNCSCHISPPCSDCVEWSGLREALSEARTAMKGEKELPTFEPVVLVDDRCPERLNWYSKFEKVLPDGTKLFTESQLQQAYEHGKRDAVPEWISVEERLPVLHNGYSEDCLVITNFGNRLISRYDSYSKSWSLYQHEDHIVTLWMTLLAAPKGD